MAIEQQSASHVSVPQVEHKEYTLPVRVIVTVNFGRIIAGETEPNLAEDIFLVEYYFKSLKVPEDFCVYGMIADVPQLEAHLNSGETSYDWQQAYHGDPEEDEVIAQIEAPLNDVDAYFTLTWKLIDVQFTPDAYRLLRIYHSYISQEELEKKSIGELRILAKLKGANLCSKDKTKQIQNILVKESHGEYSVYSLKPVQQTPLSSSTQSAQNHRNSGEKNQ